MKHMTIYMAAALIVILIGVIRAIGKRNDFQAMTLTLTGAISLAIGILTFPYNLQYSDLPIAIIESIRSGLSGVAMGVNGDIPYDMELDRLSFRVFRFFLYALYIFGPIAGSMFLVSFFAKFRNALSLLTGKHFYVFSGLNEKSLLIAESVMEKDKDATVVFCSSKGCDPTLASSARSLRALLLDGEDYRIKLFRNRKYEFFEIDGEETDRIKAAAKLCEELLKQDAYEAGNVIVRIFASQNQRELILNLDRQYSNRIYLRHVDENAAMAIDALSFCSDILAVKQECNVALIADNEAAKPFLTDLIWLLIKPEGSYSISLIGPKSDRLYESLKEENPEIVPYPVKVFTCNYGKEAELLEDPDLVFVLYEDDKQSYDTAMKVRRTLSGRNEDLSCPRIMCRINDPDFHKMIRENDIILFGDPKKTIRYDKLVNPKLEEAAERVHLSYMLSTEVDPKEKEKILKDSGFYQYQNQESSFAQALAMTYKQKYILQFKKDDTRSEKEFIDEWLSKEENMKRMADAEHERWNAYERTHGWRKADEKQTAGIIRKYEGRRANDPELKLHPALVENEELPAVEEMVNRLLEEYGTDYRIHYLAADRDIIRKLTYILK
ncbi:MAG: hypothetical protein IJI44_04215 [Erysipelotrichaceae bacterium]|nr:hypothetical protein [Erysipelotrichaceae bacterium]